MNSENYLLLEENVSHGDIGFPLDIYYGHFYKTFDTYLHWHNEMEILYILDGYGKVSLDLQIYDVKKGDFIFVKPGALHYIIGDRVSVFKCCAIVFNLSLLHTNIIDYCEHNFISPIINDIVYITPIISPTTIGYDYICNYFNLILKSYNTMDLGYQLEIKGFITLIISKLFNCNLIKDIDKKNQSKKFIVEKIQNVITYINKNYMNSISIKELADIACYSEYHFIRFFKKQTGKNVTEFINSLRIEKSTYLLSTTDLSITTIAHSTGFNDSSYFIKIFKKEFGVSPQKFRKDIR